MRRVKADWSSKWLTKPKIKAAQPQQQALQLLKGKLVVAVDAVEAAVQVPVVMVDAGAVMATVAVVTTSAVVQAQKMAAKN
jgi:hypothetical protein